VNVNEQALAEAGRHYRKLNVAFWVCMALIPLGVVLPCLVSFIAYEIAGDEWSAPIALSALLWPIVGVAGTLLLRGGRKRARRSLELARLANAFGLRYQRTAPPESYAFLRSISLMENPHIARGENLMEGMPGAWPLMSLDYHYSFHWGSVTEYADQTIVAFVSGFEHLPPFAVVPISIMGRIENLFLGKSGAIGFPHAPQFNSQFAVVGGDAARIAQLVTPQLIEMLLRDKLLTIVAEQGRLLVFRRLTIVRAEDYQGFLAQAYSIAELLASPA
jgi:hypothetical protein